MHSLRVVSILALAAATLATPASLEVPYGGGGGGGYSGSSPRQYSVYSGVDMIGYDIARYDGLKEYECLQKCSATPACLAYIYVPLSAPASSAPTFCYLKGQIVLPIVTLSQVAPTDFGLVGPCGSYPSITVAKCFNVSG